MKKVERRRDWTRRTQEFCSRGEAARGLKGRIGIGGEKSNSEPVPRGGENENTDHRKCQ